jgi:hypothetical protein
MAGHALYPWVRGRVCARAGDRGRGVGARKGLENKGEKELGNRGRQAGACRRVRARRQERALRTQWNGDGSRGRWH